MRIGIDLGGTKTEAVLLDDHGEFIARVRQPTRSDSYDEIIDGIARLVAELEAKAGAQCRVGIGMPGTISPSSGRVKNSNTTVLNGRAFDVDLQARLDRPLRFENDANCFALSEAIDGAATDVDSVFGVIIGTGTGGGIVVNQAILRGSNAIGGEWGHNPLPWPRATELPGPDCYCGKRGCLETYLSGAGLSRAYEESGGGAADAIEIAARANADEATAGVALELYCDRAARGLASVINIVDPAIIVVGGGLSNIPQLYELVPAMLPNYVFSDHISTRLVAAKHGDSSGVRGAAWLWPRENR